jgi:hypothetical protein
MPRVRPHRVFSLEIIVVPTEVDRNQTAWLDTMRSPMTDLSGVEPHVRRADALATATLTRRGCSTSRGVDRVRIYAIVAASQRFRAGLASMLIATATPPGTRAGFNQQAGKTTESFCLVYFLNI